jgi:Kef-type K+ transport system membrane component KefB
VRITVTIAPETALAIIAVAAVAGTIAALASHRGVVLPVVVLELVAGVLIGPHVAGLKITATIMFFKALGLGLLFFFAGYEVDLRRIAGRPLRLGGAGWVISLLLAYAAVAILRATGMHLEILYVGSALATTAIGTLIPILSDSGELRTGFGTYLLAAGAMGEFGPILLLTLVLSTEGSLHNALILVAFVAAAGGVGLFATRSAELTLPVLKRTLRASSQLAVRWVLVLIFGLALLAFRLGLDLLIGGFAAGLIVREMIGREPIPEFNSKLSAIAFGLFVPYFFVASGMGLQIASFESAAGLLRVGLFFALMLLVRGIPALVLYRRELNLRDRRALALMSSTQLPLVLAISALAVSVGRMTNAVAAELVGAAVLSTLAFPVLALRLRGRPQADTSTPAAAPIEIA